jgi:hypothetical protein
MEAVRLRFIRGEDEIGPLYPPIPSIFGSFGKTDAAAFGSFGESDAARSDLLGTSPDISPNNPMVPNFMDSDVPTNFGSFGEVDTPAFGSFGDGGMRSFGSFGEIVGDPGRFDHAGTPRSPSVFLYLI